MSSSRVGGGGVITGLAGPLEADVGAMAVEFLRIIDCRMVITRDDRLVDRA